ncbi:E3 ubiquitin-protein ligase Midline-1-like [Haliotis rufescens]|uniref:E3 ubiquitin-protein ligase Midline-1-like n=1 Tax=Haliotis rufescens TaxID=6454 RepID=UPI00201EE8E4|nr:E3 ubiquitin-protein ligase Midline-1-like [Haliotis rufescens]
MAVLGFCYGDVTAEKVMEFLTCVICQELYTDPCTLRCDHTFCRKCVTEYIQTIPDAVQSKTIPCAFCRQDTKVPDPSRPVEEWAGQIKPSIIIQGLIDTQAGATTEDTGAKCCTLCDQLGETTQAISWCPDCEVTLCERCVKMHRASPSSRDHEPCDLSGDIKVMKRRKVMCQEHKAEQVKYLCKDCNKTLCQSCCVVYHRKCESVVTINSQVARMKSELALRSDILRTKCDGKRNRIERKKFKIDKIKDDKVTVREQVNLIANKAIEYIRQKEKKLLDELDEITEKHIIQTHADVKLQEIEMQMYKQHCEFIDQVLISDCQMDLYDAYQAWESGAVELVDVRDTDTADTRRIDDIRFTPDTDNVQHILDDLQLGKIDLRYGDGPGLKCSPVLFHTLDATSEDDEGIPGMPGVTELNLKEKHVMVAVPASRHIVTVEVTPDLVLLSTITTSKGYYSLTVLSPSSLAAGGWGGVDILDMGGHVLRSVTTHNKETLFTLPSYMSVNTKGNILVSDWKKKSVTCLTSEGDVVWRYAPTGDMALHQPSGIFTTNTGDIMFIDQLAEAIILLSETGEYVSDVITSQDGMSQPLSLCINKHDSVLVTCGREIKTFILT